MAEIVTLRKCPICGQPAAFRYRPFCSRRCADVDLGRWFTGTYAVPGEPEVEAEIESEPPDRDGVDDRPPRRPG